MRTTFLAALTLSVVMAQTDPGRAQTTGTQSELADDALGAALWHIAVATQTQIGFESVEFVRLPGQLKKAAAFPVASRDEALNAAIVANPRYEWRLLGDAVVVRPKSAWNAADDPFNRPVRNLRVENTTENGVFLGIRDFIYTDRFAPLPRDGTPVAFEVPSGTVVDVLNQLTQSVDAVLWNAAYRPHPTPEQRYPTWDLKLQLVDAKVLRELSESHPPRGGKK